eukprot:3495054-Rhodomonas_salina.1
MRVSFKTLFARRNTGGTCTRVHVYPASLVAYLRLVVPSLGVASRQVVFSELDSESHFLLPFAVGIREWVHQYQLSTSIYSAALLLNRRNIRHPFFMRIPMGYGCLSTWSTDIIYSDR